MQTGHTDREQGQPDTTEASDDLWEQMPVTLAELYGAEQPAQVAIDYVKGVLLSRIFDPVERWEELARFTAMLPEALEHMRALCVGQLTAEGMSVEEAGRALGVNRQRASALLSDHDQPTPRQMKKSPLEPEPGFRFGVFLGVASMIAATLDATKPSLDARRQLEKIEQSAHMIPRQTVAQVHERIARWTRNQRKGPRYRQLLHELDVAAAHLDDLPQHLDMAQQSHMWVARSKTRLRLERDNPAKP